MVSVPAFISSRRQAILEAARRHGASSVRLFGSQARHEAAAGSDVDLLIEMEPGRSLLEQVALWQELQVLLGRDVDLVDAAALHWFIRDRVLKEAVPL
jgi:uncharacterized protein